MDPSPFPEKDLDHDAEEFIVSWAQEFHRRDPLVLRIDVNEPLDPSETPQLIEKALHNYFAYRHSLNRLEFRRLMKEGRMSLLIGSVFLAVCLMTSELLGKFGYGALITIARESLIIGGWVAMWRPMQIFLYEWWPLQGIGQIYWKLSRAPVELRGASPASSVGAQVLRNQCQPAAIARTNGASH